MSSADDLSSLAAAAAAANAGSLLPLTKCSRSPAPLHHPSDITGGLLLPDMPARQSAPPAFLSFPAAFSFVRPVLPTRGRKYRPAASGWSGGRLDWQPGACWD